MIRDLNIKLPFFDLNDRNLILNYLKDANFVINCTSVGMNPDGDSSILTREEINSLPNDKIYFDVVFNPWETKFLQYAKENNNKIISGGMMLIYQGILAFEVWTDIKVTLTNNEIEKLKEDLKSEINKH